VSRKKLDPLWLFRIVPPEFVKLPEGPAVAIEIKPPDRLLIVDPEGVLIGEPRLWKSPELFSVV
jgi:hypothetical protein